MRDMIIPGCVFLPPGYAAVHFPVYGRGLVGFLRRLLKRPARIGMRGVWIGPGDDPLVRLGGV